MQGVDEDPLGAFRAHLVPHPPQKLAPWFFSPKGLATIPSQSQGRMLQGRDHANPNSKFGSGGGGSRVSIITGAHQACRRYPVTSEPK